MLSSALGLVAGLTVAAVFAAAGLGKLTDRKGTRKAVAEFGAPDRLVAPLALLLPVAELGIAVALLFAATRPAGAVGALVLLGIFSTAIAVSLARGQAPDCHCFGQLHSAPASWKTLVRNAALAGLGVVALAERGPGAFGWIGNLTPVGALALATGVVAVGLLTGGGLAFVSLLRSHGRVLLRLDTVESALREAGIEMPEDEASRLREAGEEYGATTGRPRRCGWLDLPALRYAARVNGLDALIVTKLDVLDAFGEIRVAVGYESDSGPVASFPSSAHELERCRPVYLSFPGWSADTTGVRRWRDLPANARAYLDWIEREAGVPISSVSVGAAREAEVPRG